MYFKKLVNFKDDFLANTTKLVRLEEIDRNRTLSIQQSSSDTPEDVREKMLTSLEIRQFFKSLLTYIPTTTPRLDDLLIEHKSHLNDRYRRLDTTYRDRCLHVIRASVLAAQQFGITLFELRHRTNEKLASERLPTLQLKQLLKLIEFLVENFVILVVGVVEQVYVCHEFKQHWVIESYKSLKGKILKAKRSR